MGYYPKIMCYSTVTCRCSKLLPERKPNLRVLNCISHRDPLGSIFQPATSPQWTPRPIPR